jgi:hypothetical protein
VKSGPSLDDLATYLRVERAIAQEADRLCAERCANMCDGRPCRRSCNAVAHGWRSDAVASLRAAARLREQREQAA